MLIKKEKNEQLGTSSHSRRSFLKAAIATILATTLNIFPEFGRVVKATTFYNCVTGGTSYCCDIQTGYTACDYDFAFCKNWLLKYQFYAICNAVFGCDHTCMNLCTGPWYTCAWSCYAAPSCQYCTTIV